MAETTNLQRSGVMLGFKCRQEMRFMCVIIRKHTKPMCRCKRHTLTHTPMERERERKGMSGQDHDKSTLKV